MSIPPLEQTLCLNCCTYYKPGKNEQFACQGYLVAERLLDRGKKLTIGAFSSKFGPAIAEQVIEKMCMNCEFHEKDCDFMEDRSLPPCGGFLVLSQSIVAGEITIKDIE